MVRATVVIPTHAHGPLLRLAAASALAQTVADLEVFIVLDGADAATHDAAADVANSDHRVRLFPHEKGERHGEAFRHLALQQAQGRIVCYLSDDDLWFPDHVEYLEHLLDDADFAHSLTVVAQPGGRFDIPFLGDLADPWYRDWLVGPHNFIPLAAAGHTLEAYRSLPVGWSPAPPAVWTDLHMWRKFLAAPGLRLVSGGRPTLLHFPSPPRRHMDLPARLAEMESWWERLQAPGGWQALRIEANEQLAARGGALVRERVQLEAELGEARTRLMTAEQATESMRSELATRQTRLAASESEADRRTAELAASESEANRLTAELAASESEANRLTAELAAIQGSIAYRASRRLAGVPVIGRIGRWAARALVGRGAR